MHRSTLSLPSFGELMESIRETEMDVTPSHTSKPSTRRRAMATRTPSPEWNAGIQGVSIIVSEPTPDKRTEANPQAPSLLRRGRLSRYQPYVTVSITFAEVTVQSNTRYEGQPT